jgi:hypothetical protein
MKSLSRLASVVALFAFIATPASAQESRWNELANAPMPDGYPSDETRMKLLDELYFQRAVQVYLVGCRQ